MLIILVPLSLTNISIWSGQTRGKTLSCSPIDWQNRQNATKSYCLIFLECCKIPFSWRNEIFSIQNQIYRKTITAPLRKIAHIASECFTHCILLLGFCTLSFSREVFTKFMWSYWGCCHFLLNSLQFWFFVQSWSEAVFTSKKLLPEEKKRWNSSTEDVMTECVSDQQVFPYDRSIHKKIIKWNCV